MSACSPAFAIEYADDGVAATAWSAHIDLIATAFWPAKWDLLRPRQV
ncbi:hypothetical protein IAG44_01040 [Streptomyces roseirectus]|uniref:Uncharacterized protein n=1 Tax=Streptomyces roseirectus TaxID=2768066 RepID=A0A7H0I5X1_9ACTN|nr:hypothetical protein [Streptomyces roseirectus]QNP68187.1 hypothetical protein IAG44_01040 [Streptomyces roseirectus]